MSRSLYVCMCKLQSLIGAYLFCFGCRFPLRETSPTAVCSGEPAETPRETSWFREPWRRTQRRSGEERQALSQHWVHRRGCQVKGFGMILVSVLTFYAGYTKNIYIIHSVSILMIKCASDIPDFKAITVFWWFLFNYSYLYVCWSWLSFIFHLSRYLIMSQQIMGGVPPIVFLRDKQLAALDEVLSIYCVDSFTMCCFFT